MAPGAPDPPGFDLVIFDCDGVLVDSEIVTNRVFAAMIGELGVEVTLEHMFERFMGHSMAHCLTLVRDLIGRDPPADFVAEYRRRSEAALADEVVAVAGVEQVLDGLPIPWCVASNGTHGKMRISLGKAGLVGRCASRLFSATEVARPKPAPDLFLYAASRLGAAPARTAVVEDSPAGIAAAVEAGMSPFGFAARIPPARLHAAGAAVVFEDMRDLPALLGAGGSIHDPHQVLQAR